MISADGGQVGVIFGNSLVRADLGLMEYYTSVSDIAGTVDLHTNHAAIRFYPIHLFTKKSIRLAPYLNAGLTYDRYKFYGHYASNNSGPVNYSAPEPFLGAIKQVNTSLGIGLEYKILDAYDFVHLFTEAKWGGPVKQEIPGSEFGHTQLGRKMMVSVGVGFGRYK